MGYRVTSNALPVAPTHIAAAPAVVAADPIHIAQPVKPAEPAPASDDAQSDDDTTVVGTSGVPQETPEVAAARAAHMAAHEAIKSRSKRSAALYTAYSAPLAYTTPLAHYNSLAYSAPLAYASHYAPLAYSAIAKTSSQATVINHGSPAYYYY